MDADALYLEVVDKTAKYINPYLSKLLAFAGFGVEMKGEGCYIYDQEGKKYLDCLGGYGTFALGHRHPRVVEAVKNQLDQLALSGKAFFSKPQADLAEKLAQLSPEGLQYTFFCNSGAEAVEAALKFAKCATGRSKIISTHGAYHGKTIGALSTTGRPKYQRPFEPLMPGVEFVDFGSIEQAERAIDESTAAIIIEAIQGEGGIIEAPAGYLKALRRRCDETGALLIVDEVQTGIGRTGEYFASKTEGITPDLMPLAKALGGGIMPIGACMGTPEVWENVFGKNPLLHTSTFGGNPLACTAGLAALETIESENLLQNCKIQGEALKSCLQEVQRSNSDFVAEVRGRGLMIGVELTMDEVGELLVAQMLKRGLCVAYTLNNPRVLRFEPPLIITAEQVQFAVETFASALAETKELLATLV